MEIFMKKIQILLTLIITIALLCFGCGKNEPATETDNNAAKQAAEDNKLSLNKISAPRWDDISPDFYIDIMLCYDNNDYDYDDDDFVYSSDCDYEIPAYENMKNICEKNKEYITDKGKYKDNEGNTHDAVYFFYNNNAYVLYDTEISEDVPEEETSTWVHLRNRMIWDEIDYSDPRNGIYQEYLVKVPFPVCVNIDSYTVRECWENEENWDEKHLFSLCTFDEAKKFYNMFSEGTAFVDDENEVIKVRGTVSSPKSNENKPVWAILDFRNKTYEVQNENGSFYHSCNTLYDRIEKNYRSAGTIDGKEVIYDLCFNIIIKENGKRRILMDDREMNDFLEHKIPGYNCVCEDCTLKLIKIKGKKYYFDVTAVMMEDGHKWTYNNTLVMKDDFSK